MDQTKEIDIDLKKIFVMLRKKVVYILLFVRRQSIMYVIDT